MAEMKPGQPRTHRRWAIFTDSHGLVGVGRFIGAGKPETVTAKYPYLVSTMLFRSRREAREALLKVKGPADRGLFPSARVVRVQVTVELE